jgi:hypothetical protein
VKRTYEMKGKDLEEITEERVLGGDSAAGFKME